MIKIYKKRIYCQTDSKWEYKLSVENEDNLTCPVDKNHKVNKNSISLVEIYEENKIKIETENIPFKSQGTKGRYQMKSKAFDCPAKACIDYTWNYSYPISIISGYLTTTESMHGDTITIDFYKKESDGILEKSTSKDDKSIFVNEAFTKNINIGNYIKIFTNTDSTDYIHINKINDNELLLDTQIDFKFEKGTCIKYIVRFCEIEVGSAGKYDIGANNLNTLYLPVDTNIIFSYDNKSITLQKRPVFYLEFFY